MARDELAVVPHVQQPDVSTQTKVYLAGLKPQIREALGGRLTQTDSIGIKYCIPGLGGWRFPDIAWKDAHFNQATSNTARRCTYCHNLQEEQQGKDPNEWHFRQHCPSPLVSHQPVHA